MDELWNLIIMIDYRNLFVPRDRRKVTFVNVDQLQMRNDGTKNLAAPRALLTLNPSVLSSAAHSYFCVFVVPSKELKIDRRQRRVI